jgi:hypothetical protein
MLRALALSLIGANVLLFAWAQGWLGALAPAPPALQGREPERLQQQVRPEALTVLRPRAVAAALGEQGASMPAASGAAAAANRPGDSGAATPAATQPPR